MFFRRSLHYINTHLLCSHRLASTTSSAVVLKLQPELYHGVFTKFGWVLVRKTHVAQGWTQAQINKELEAKLGAVPEEIDRDYLQQIVDIWVENANLKDIPKPRKKSASEIKLEKDMKLLLHQMRYEDTMNFSGSSAKEAGSKTFKEPSDDNVSFTHAWNYFTNRNFVKHSELSRKEARQKLGVEWRELRLEEKESYRQEYARLLKQGKDILHGNIVDKKTKTLASKKLWDAKERVRLRKLGVLPPTTRSTNMKPPKQKE